MFKEGADIVDVIDFLLDPDYEKIKDFVDIVKEEYIDEYGEENRDLIEKNISKLNYIFKENVMNIERFIDYVLDVEYNRMCVYFEKEGNSLVVEFLRKSKVLGKGLLVVLEELKKVDSVYNFYLENINYYKRLDGVISKKAKTVRR